MDSICGELQKLGVTANYKGYRQTALAVWLALEREERLQNITKDIYWAVARQAGCSRPSVERNIRTAAQAAWRANPSRLQAMARRPLESPPAASELIVILVCYIQRRPAVRPVPTFYRAE